MDGCGGSVSLRGPRGTRTGNRRGAAPPKSWRCSSGRARPPACHAARQGTTRPAGCPCWATLGSATASGTFEETGPPRGAAPMTAAGRATAGAGEARQGGRGDPDTDPPAPTRKRGGLRRGAPLGRPWLEPQLAGGGRRDSGGRDGRRGSLKEAWGGEGAAGEGSGGSRAGGGQGGGGGEGSGGGAATGGCAALARPYIPRLPLRPSDQTGRGGI